MAPPIRNIIFDFGGVLLDIDYARTAAALEELAGRPQLVFSQAEQLGFVDAFETGQIDAPTFRRHLRDTLQSTASDEALDAAWNALLGDLPAARIDWVASLRPERRTFLLSNTNILHQRAFEATIAAGVGQSRFEAAFERIYYSHDLGLAKPDARAFTAILNEHGLAREATLFVDDSPKNVAGAAAIGLQTLLLPPGIEVAEACQRFLSP